VEQALLLRGSRNFESREAYEGFLQDLLKQLNAGRRERLAQELKLLKGLPERRLDDCKKERVKVGPGSTVRVKHNTYSVHSCLIGEWVEAWIYAQQIEIRYAQRKVEVLPRLKGEGNHRIAYRHIIDWLVRKPGAFENYRYRDDLFPGSYFRITYDYLKEHHTHQVAVREYLQILHLAAKDSEAGVEAVLRELVDKAEPIGFERVKAILYSGRQLCTVKDIHIPKVDLDTYDDLLDSSSKEVANG
jgi:hypothetical protein